MIGAAPLSALGCRRPHLPTQPSWSHQLRPMPLPYSALRTSYTKSAAATATPIICSKSKELITL